jgi:drug/metabolite transporter (DMT)-like permease
MVYFPIIGALALASGTLLEKITLKKKSISPKLYQSTIFLSIVILMLPMLFFFWKLDPLALTPLNILIFASVILFSLLANYFSFYSLKWEKLSKIEPAKMMEPLFVILLVLIVSFFIDSGFYERDYKIIIPAIIAGLAIVFSHIKKHHLSFNKYFRFAMLGSFFFALELVISRLILDFYSPISFYFFRCLFITIFSFIIFKPKIKKIDKNSRFLISGAALIWVVYRVVVYYGYTSLGIAETTLMIMLGPIFIYLFAWKFLKEKISKRNIVASIVILASVLYGLFA